MCVKHIALLYAEKIFLAIARPNPKGKSAQVKL